MALTTETASLRPPKVDTSALGEFLWWPALVLAVAVVGFFIWLHIREWRRERAFRRFWEGKKAPARR